MPMQTWYELQIKDRYGAVCRLQYNSATGPNRYKTPDEAIVAGRKLDWRWIKGFTVILVTHSEEVYGLEYIDYVTGLYKFAEECE